MAKIFEDQTTNYDGLAEDVAEGAGTVLVYFKVSDQDASLLTLMVRKTGTTDEFIALRQVTQNSAFKFDADGWDYYFKWTINTTSGNQISATLDV